MSVSETRHFYLLQVEELLESIAEVELLNSVALLHTFLNVHQVHILFLFIKTEQYTL